MSVYPIVLFLHVTSVLVLFIGMGVSHVAIDRMEKAQTREIAYEYATLTLINGPIFAVASVCIVATGLHMSVSAWSLTAPWIFLSLLFIVVSTLTGFVVMFRRMSAVLGALTGAPDGPLSPELSARRKDPVAALLPSALAGNAIGTLFLMTNKPGWVESIAILAFFSALGMVPVFPRAREAMRAWKRARDLPRMNLLNGGKPILCGVMDPKLVVVETVSPFTLKAHRALKAAGVDYITRRASQTSDYNHLNPKGQIPILILKDEIICGSREIVRLCVEWAPQKFETHLTGEQQADVHFWEEYSENVIKGYIAAARWADDSNWARAEAAYFIDVPFFVRPIIIPRIRRGIIRMLKTTDVWRGGTEEGMKRFSQDLDYLELRAPAQGYWIGTTKLTPADISLFAFLQCLRTPITPWWHEEIIARKKLNAYLDRVEAATNAQESPTTKPVTLQQLRTAS